MNSILKALVFLVTLLSFSSAFAQGVECVKLNGTYQYKEKGPGGFLHTFTFTQSDCASITISWKTSDSNLKVIGQDTRVFNPLGINHTHVGHIPEVDSLILANDKSIETRVFTDKSMFKEGAYDVDVDRFTPDGPNKIKLYYSIFAFDLKGPFMLQGETTLLRVN